MSGKTGAYRLPSHAKVFFGSKPSTYWGGVPWEESERGGIAFLGMASSWEDPRAGLQIWKTYDRRKCRAILIETDCDIDFDGPSNVYSPFELKAMDRYWLPDTSLHTRNGKAIDSRRFNGIVLPQYFTALGMRLGDFCLVCYGGRIRAAQWYDIGPSHKIGEVSHRLAGELAIPNHPTIGNSVLNLITLMFPGSGKPYALDEAAQFDGACKCFLEFTGRHCLSDIETKD